MIRLLGTTYKDDEVLLFYSYPKLIKNFFKIITSKDGFEFNGSTKYVIVTDPKGREEPKYDWARFSLVKQKDGYVATYKVNGKGPNNLNVVQSKEMLRWTKLGKIENIQEIGSIAPEYQNKNRYIMYYGENDIKLAYSSQFTTWKLVDKPVLEKREGKFDDGELEVGKAFTQK